MSDSSISGVNGSKRRPVAARRANQRGVTLVLATMMFGLMLIPAAGLAVDAGLMYLVKVRLSAAADAAALAGARAFSRGSNGPEQNTNAQLTAETYFNSNFPTGYFWSTNRTINAVATTESQFLRSVTTQASVQLPMLFMRIFRDNPSTIRAYAKATRRDVNVMIVMDRSGSLQTSGACAPLKTAAANFVEKFSEGRDNLGLITFATSSLLDRALSSTFKTAVRGTLTALVCDGWTSTAQALWQGYEELVRLNQGGALNVIVLFSDGLPTSVTQDYPITVSGRTCHSAGPIRGVLAASPRGLYNWVALAQPFSNDTRLAPNSTGCRYASNFNDVAIDLAYAPLTDIWGNQLNPPNRYRSVSTRSLGLNESSASNITNFSTNAADHAALRIRRGDVTPTYGRSLPVTVMTIGYGAGVDATLMRRMANDPALSPNPVAAGAQGRFFYADTPAALDLAFTRVASEILRLAQ